MASGELLERLRAEIARSRQVCERSRDIVRLARILRGDRVARSDRPGVEQEPAAATGPEPAARQK